MSRIDRIKENGINKDKWMEKGAENKVIYLTFDDGPDSLYTWRLLELLRQYRIRASFFVVASFARQNPEIMKRMKEDGHLIGLHSLNHKSAYISSPEYVRKDFGASMLILKGLGIQPEYYRAPWGHYTSRTYAEMEKYGLYPVGWDVMAQDWRAHTSAGKIVEKLKKRTMPGSIICLHDGRGRNHAPERTLLALRLMLPYWLEQGYTFETVDMCGHAAETVDMCGHAAESVDMCGHTAEPADVRSYTVDRRESAENWKGHIGKAVNMNG